jgi:hypothetical protein
MKKGSQEESDALEWVVVSLPLGGTGLDLRRPDAPETLTELLNAKYINGGTVGRRDGHFGRGIQGYTLFHSDKRVTKDWVYGHGTRIIINGKLNWENSRHPVHIRGAGAFELGDIEVVWTGDRMFVVTAEGPFYGSNDFWDRTE